MLNVPRNMYIGRHIYAYTHLMRVGERRVLDEVISPDAGPVVHRVPFLVNHPVTLGDHPAAATALSLSPSPSHPLSLVYGCTHTDPLPVTVICSCRWVLSKVVAASYIDTSRGMLEY